MVGFEMTKSRETLHPGRILLSQAMEPLGISRNQLARDIDVPVGRISDITNGKRGVTADTALRLGRYFGTGPELWLRLQAEFDLYVARMTTWPAVESRVRVLQAEAPVDDTLAVVDAKVGEDDFYESELEPLAEILDEEASTPLDLVRGDVAKPPPLSGVMEASSGDPDNADERPEGPSEEMVVSARTDNDDVDADGAIEPPIDLESNLAGQDGSGSHPEEELGIPPIPDRSKSVLSG